MTNDYGWRYEPIGNREAFIVTPGGQRLARMTEARARGIVAALNTEEGMRAFGDARVEGRTDYVLRPGG